MTLAPKMARHWTGWGGVGLALLLLFIASAARAQTLIHRYSFNGNANDSVGTANGTVVGGVTFNTNPGLAIFPGGSTSTSPSFISLPVSAVNTLQNATIEIFTTAFSPDQDTPSNFQALFAAGTSQPSTTNYTILSANRANAGIGTGARINNGTEQVVASATDPLPQGYSNHVIDLVFSGFNGVGSMGRESIYVDGAAYFDNSTGNTVSAATLYSFAYINSGTGGIQTVGIGGGSSFAADPTFAGTMDEVRIFNGALSPAQIAANAANGPDAALPELPALPLLALGLSLSCLGGLKTVHKKGLVITRGKPLLAFLHAGAHHDGLYSLRAEEVHPMNCHFTIPVSPRFTK